MRQQAAKISLWLIISGILSIGMAEAQVSMSTAAERRPISNLGIAVSDGNGSHKKTRAPENSDLPDAPSTTRENEEQDAPPATAPTIAAPMRQSPGTALGPTFLAANGALLGSTVANIEMISNCRPTACQAVPSSIRDRGKLYAIGIPATLGVSYISYRLKRGGTKLWIVPVALFTAGNVVYAAHAAQWSR